MLTGKNLIACAPSDAAEGRFTAGGALAEFEEASSAHVDHDEWFERFVRRMEILIGQAQPGTMLYPAIFESYAAGVQRLSALGDTRTVRSSMGAGVPLGCARGK